jgi:hypothetical protein
VFAAGYDVARLAWLLADLPVELLGRVRSDRVYCFPAQQRARTDRPPRHGPLFSLAEPVTHPTPAVTTSTDTTRYGTALAETWSRLHPGSPIKAARRATRPDTDHRGQPDPADRGPAAR